MTNQLRPFNDSDWDGFAGACELPDGSGPFIREMDGGIIIVSGDDARGDNLVAIDIFLADTTMYGRSGCVTPEFVKFVAEALREEDLNADRLLALGFSRY